MSASGPSDGDDGGGGGGGSGGGEADPEVPVVVWIAFVLPLAGLSLLLARPSVDHRWEHHPSHFWLVLLTALVSVVLAYLTNIAAGRYRDARLILVSLAFLA